jgi:hypothetical protein
MIGAQRWGALGENGNETDAEASRSNDKTPKKSVLHPMGLFSRAGGKSVFGHLGGFMQTSVVPMEQVDEKDDDDYESEASQEKPPRMERKESLADRGNRLGNTRSGEKLAKGRNRSHRAQKMWAWFENKENVGQKYVHLLIFVFVLFPIIQSSESAFLEWIVWAIIESIFDGLMGVELLLRFLVCPSRVAFFQDFYNWIDIVSFIPMTVRILVMVEFTSQREATLVECILSCVVPLIRLLKMLRHFQMLHLLLNAFRTAFEALPVLLFTMMAIVLLFASLMFLVEPLNMVSVTGAIYYCLVTISTVGFGDVVSVTLGQVVTMIMIVSGVLYMSMPLGIIGHAFTDAWADRDRIILVQHIHQSFTAHGYTASDMPILFEIFDTSIDGNLNFREFYEMLREMNIGLSDERCLALFKALDANSSGVLECHEFVRAIFPASYKELYGNETRHSTSTSNALALIAEGESSAAMGDLEVEDLAPESERDKSASSHGSSD